MDHNTSLTIGNFLLYAFFCLYIYKKKGFSIGLYLVILYSTSALFSVFMVVNPYYNEFSLSTNLYIIPYVYLFICLILILYPLCISKPSKIHINVKNVPTGKLELFVNVFLIIQIICILLIIPDVITALSRHDLSESRLLVYGGEAKSSFTLIYKYKITKLFSIILEAIKPFTILISFYLAFVKKIFGNKGLIFFITSVGFSLLRSLVIVSRGEIVFLLLYLLFILLLFKKSINPRIFNRLIFYSLISLGVFIPFYWAVSISRFGDLVNFHFFRYVGESMCNFNGNMFYELKKTLDFNVYFPLSAIGQKDTFDTAIEKWDIIESQTGVSGQYFYTIIGGFLFSFGKILTLFICLAFNRIYSKIIKWNFSSLSRLIPLVFLGDIMIRGIFLFPMQGMSGNLEIVFMFVLMYYFKK